jgi:hypothetical protein
MPIDTAVNATTSESASATVANSSTPARRRFAFAFSAIGEVKPTFPFSAVIVVILESVFAGPAVRRANQLFRVGFRNAAKCRRCIGRTLAKSLRKKGKFVILVKRRLTADCVTAILRRRGFAATKRRAYAKAAAASGRNSIGT